MSGGGWVMIFSLDSLVDMIRDLLLDQLCATADNSVEEKGVINFLPNMNAWGGGRHVM